MFWLSSVRVYTTVVTTPVVNTSPGSNVDEKVAWPMVVGGIQTACAEGVPGKTGTVTGPGQLCIIGSTLINAGIEQNRCHEVLEKVQNRDT